MLNLNDLKPAKGATHHKHRVGRGSGSGWGSTSGRGNNGAKQRSGYSEKGYFEGGQLPLIRRLPKRGFTNVFKKYYQVVNVSDIDSIAKNGDIVDAQYLFSAGKIHSKDEMVKVLGNGEIKKSITIKADAFSKSAEEKITKAKGKTEVVARA
ncbi:MAG: 50S ribosomal protein L15 [Chitinivibrionia bacterium]|jgi:large subunit ribosomal protein L15|nr:50S ribosomal protein L15 [Chitinivibrionia bacterium]